MTMVYLGSMRKGDLIPVGLPSGAEGDILSLSDILGDLLDRPFVIECSSSVSATLESDLKSFFFFFLRELNV